MRPVIGGAGDEVDLADEAAFDELYRRELPRVTKLVRLLTGEPSVVEDLAHEVFIRLRRANTTGEQPDAFVRAVTVNVCRNWHRGRTREQARIRRAAPVDRHVDGVTDGEMDAVVLSLPYRQRAVLVLRYWLDLSEADIAGALGVRPGTVKSLHARAMETLRKELADDR